MNQFQIITDSCADLPQDMIQELQLCVIPLSIEYQGKSLLEGEIPMKEIYHGLRQGEPAKTAAVNPETWSQTIEPFLKDGTDVLVITFSSGLSCTYQSAVIAGEELRERYPHRNIRIIDSLCASMGQGLLVWYAAKLRDAGQDLDAVAQWVESHKLNLCHWFTVDDLMFLKRGGRVSGTAAVMGTMLQIKPVLHVDHEGHLIPMAKARGRKASLQALVEKLYKTGLPGENETVFLSHGDCIEDAEYVAQLLKDRCGVKNVVINYVGSVIGSHSGPGTVALFFLGSSR